MGTRRRALPLALFLAVALWLGGSSRAVAAGEGPGSCSLGLSRTGGSGLFDLALAEAGCPWRLRVGVALAGFSQGGYLLSDDSFIQLAGAVQVAASIGSHLETSLQIGGRASRVVRPLMDTKPATTSLLALGAIALTVKLHTQWGRLVHAAVQPILRVHSGPDDLGPNFRSADLGVDIPAHVDHVAAINYATVLGRDGATVETVEHLLAALVSAGVDNVIVELTQREVPIMDGSSAPFLFLIQEAGLKKQTAARRYLKVLRPITVASGDKHIAIYPSDHFKVSYTISFDHPLLRHQSRTMRITEQSFSDDIASARTFGFLKEVEWMRQQGLALGGSLDNAIVIGDTGPLNALRFADIQRNAPALVQRPGRREHAVILGLPSDGFGHAV